LARFILLSGRSLVQGVAKEAGKFSDKYLKEVTTCQIDPDDIKDFNIEPGTNVRLTAEDGSSVVLKSTQSSLAPHRGSVFIPYGPYAGILISSKTGGTGMPSFKGITIELEPTTDEVLPIKNLLEVNYSRGISK